jgi:hypothetical protein
MVVLFQETARATQLSATTTLISQQSLTVRGDPPSAKSYDLLKAQVIISVFGNNILKYEHFKDIILLYNE